MQRNLLHTHTHINTNTDTNAWELSLYIDYSNQTKSKICYTLDPEITFCASVLQIISNHHHYYCVLWIFFLVWTIPKQQIFVIYKCWMLYFYLLNWYILSLFLSLFLPLCLIFIFRHRIIRFTLLVWSEPTISTIIHSLTSSSSSVWKRLLSSLIVCGKNL